MIRHAILAAGLVLSSASQLRIPGLPLGPGEACLFLWLGLSAARIMAGAGSHYTPAFARFALFWTVFAFALSVGAFVGFVIKDHPDTASMLHDTIAYLLMAAMTCLALATVDAEIGFRRIGWLLVVFGNAVLAPQIAMGWDAFSLSSIEPWYWDRFRGWSENPNQLALYCAILAPVSIYLAMSARGAGRIVGLAGALLPLIAGRMTKSDTFLVATVIAGTLFALLRLRTWLTAPECRFGLRYAFALLLVAGSVPLAISLAPHGMAAVDEAEVFAKGLAKDKGGDASVRTAALRLQLWGQAVRRGLESGAVGFGPGPHVERSDVLSHEVFPTPFEAHSTILDVFTQGGLLAVLALLWLVGSTLALALRARFDALAAMIAAIAVFSVSHFIIRHPIVWFALAFCAAVGVSALRPAPIGKRS